jgi:hypothetical protein
MTTPMKRLQAAESALTTEDRLLLILRAWTREQPIDRRLSDYVAPDERDEFTGWLEAINQSTGQLHTVLAFHVEWLREVEIRLGWYESLAPLLEAFALQPGPSRKKMPAFPQPRWGFEDGLPVLWGTRRSPAVPPNWAEAPAMMLEELRGALASRWKDFIALERVCQQFSARFREPVLHHRLAEALPVVRARLAEVTAAVWQHGVEVLVPEEPSDDALNVFRSYVRWDELPPAPEATERQLPWKDKEEIEAFEAEQAEMLRRQRAGA